MSIVFDLERTNQLSLLPDKDLVDLCSPIEPYQVTKSREQINLIRRNSHRIGTNTTDAEILNDGRWKSDILTFSEYYGASGGGDLILFSGVWSGEHLTYAMSINTYRCQQLENLQLDHKEK